MYDAPNHTLVDPTKKGVVELPILVAVELAVSLVIGSTLTVTKFSQTVVSIFQESHLPWVC